MKASDVKSYLEHRLYLLIDIDSESRVTSAEGSLPFQHVSQDQPEGSTDATTDRECEAEWEAFFGNAWSAGEIANDLPNLDPAVAARFAELAQEQGEAFDKLFGRALADMDLRVIDSANQFVDCLIARIQGLLVSRAMEAAR